jgi:hypothetical protein
VRTSLTFAYDYGQLYLYDSAIVFPETSNAYLDALDAANEAGLSVGVRSGVVDVLMPRQDNFAAPLEVDIEADAPPMRVAADHIIEFDLALPSGRLVLEGSGGAGEASVDVPPEHYRARLSGTGFVEAARWNWGDQGDPPDRYVLELWPAGGALKPPSELQRWAGYEERLG